MFLIIIDQRRDTTDEVTKTNAVQILIEGGLKSIKQISDNLFGDEIITMKQLGVPLMPVIVVEESGRLSSCLLKALEMFEDGEDDFLSSDSDLEMIRSPITDSESSHLTPDLSSSGESSHLTSDLSSSGNDGSISWITEEKHKQSKKNGENVDNKDGKIKNEKDNKYGIDRSGEKDSKDVEVGCQGDNKTKRINQDEFKTSFDSSKGTVQFDVNSGEDKEENLDRSQSNTNDVNKTIDGEKENQSNNFIIEYEDNKENREKRKVELRSYIRKHFDGKKFTIEDRENVFTFVMKCCQKKIRQYVSRKFILRRRA